MAYSPEFVKAMIQSNQLHFGHLKNPAAELVTPPVWLANFKDGHGGTGPLYLVGRLGQKPVYRTTNAVTHHIWLPPCDIVQTDIIIPGTVPALIKFMDDAEEEHEPQDGHGNNTYHLD
ncbi:unnamed protein product [Adineta ricciae]|uniref:Uncharacterized protein n=1 Tax=Adineta ricciae TaxID=249248 RepID=A0A815DNT8_ADIRI|nr:unnamed protein product [Adineta ricciae]CAF1548697.1 unnamed protein product [Adineta ricciae]